jgi:hypothetical protein
MSWCHRFRDNLSVSLFFSCWGSEVATFERIGFYQNLNLEFLLEKILIFYVIARQIVETH